MNRENSRLLYAILITIVACLVVFAIALTIFGSRGFDSLLFMTQRSPAVQIPVGVKNAPIATGVVTNPRITNCMLDYAPVCGTDGETYSNACTAQANEITIASKGECIKKEIVLTGSENTGAMLVVSPKKDEKICTMEYAPVCGVDTQTYSNACMAGVIKIAHTGECDTKEEKIYDTGSYLLYSNAGLGYSFAMPKYSYYSGAGAHDGASHTIAIATTETGTTDFATAPVQVWFYRVNPGAPPSEQSVKTEKGILYIKNNDITTNPKIEKIIQTVLESAK